MKAVIQRILNGTVHVDGKCISSIDSGLLVYLGIEKGDGEEELAHLAKKIANLRIFEDEAEKMNRSVIDNGGSVLIISQFTLCADTRKGNRPSFNMAETPDKAQEYLEKFSYLISSCYNIPVATGEFGARMHITYTNDGPVTIYMNTRDT